MNIKYKLACYVNVDGIVFVSRYYKDYDESKQALSESAHSGKYKYIVLWEITNTDQKEIYKSVCTWNLISGIKYYL